MKHRHGVMLIDAVVALGMLGVAAVLVGQLAVVTLREQRRGLARLDAIEQAANVLEAIRAEPFEQLDEDLARRLSSESELAHRADGGRVQVSIESTNDALATLRISVSVQWEDYIGNNLQSVTLTTLRSARQRPIRAGGPTP